MNTPSHADRKPVLASSRLVDRLIDALQSLRLAPIAAAARAFQNAAHRHPRRVSAAVLTLLAGSAVTAFGVAPLTSLPEGPSPVITQITQAVEPADLSVQLQRLDLQSLRLYRSEVTRSADTADSLLKRLGVDDMEAAQFVRNDPVASTILQGRLGKSVKAIVEDGKLIELVVRGPADTSADIHIHFTQVLITPPPPGGLPVDTPRPAPEAPPPQAEPDTRMPTGPRSPKPSARTSTSAASCARAPPSACSRRPTWPKASP